MDENIDPESHHIREMYAKYGVAMYLAQTVEAGLKNALVMAELTNSRFATIEDFDVATATNFKTVFGRLIEKFKPFLTADQPFADDLQLALLTRNQLAHHFFWDHASDTMTRDGRERMMQECDIAIELFQDISTRLEAVVNKYSAQNTSPTVFSERLIRAEEELLNRPKPHGIRSCARCPAPMEMRTTSTRDYYVCSKCGAFALLK